MALYLEVLFSIGAAAIGFLSTQVIGKFRRSGPKEFVVRSSSGKKDSIYIDGDSSEIEISNIVSDEFSFEDQVFELLSSIESKNPSIHTDQGKDIDFVISSSNVKIALECKTSFDLTPLKQIQRYFKSDTELSHIILVSEEPFTPKTLTRLKPLINEGKVKYFSLNDNMKFSEELSNEVVSISQGHDT